MKRVQVQLFGDTGNRNIEVNPRGGFLTRHVNTGTTAKTEPITVTPNLPTQTTQAPKQPLKELLQEVDDLLNPKLRINNQPIRGYHYGDAVVSPKTNPDSPLIAYWDCVMQRKSDERMAYLRNRKAVK